MTDSLNVAHIGGRWGTVPILNSLIFFFNQIELSLFDMDAEASMENSSPFKSIDYFELAISDKVGTQPVYLVHDRNASSLKKYDQNTDDLSQFHYKPGSPFFLRGVYRVKDMQVCDKKVNVETVRLDMLITSEEMSCPDILSIDAEGADHDVLIGAGQFLNLISAVCIEGNLVPIHQDGVSILDTWKYLIERGFCLIETGAQTEQNYHPHEDFQFSSKGIKTGFEDMLFIQKPNNEMSAKMLVRLSMTAMLLGSVTIAYKCFDILESNKSLETPKLIKKIYNGKLQKFALDILECRESYGKFKIPDTASLWDVPEYNLFSKKEVASKLSINEALDKTKAMAVKLGVARDWEAYNSQKAQHKTLDVIYAEYGLSELSTSFKNERLKKERFISELLSL